MKSLNIAYNPRIDQLRWLAALIVFLFHFHIEARGHGAPPLAGSWWGIVTEGQTGVGLFFTLSGFLFMQIAQHQKTIVYSDFLRNRILRIMPLFLVVFLLATSIGRDRFQPQDVLYLLTTNLGNSPTSASVVTGAAWCISLEFLFYLVFPFIARFTLEQGPRYLVRLLVLMLLFKLAAYGENGRSTLMYFSTFVGRFDQFLVGMLAATLYPRVQPWLERHAAWLAPLALFLAVANTALQARVAPFGDTHAPFWITWSLQESVVWAGVIVAWVSLRRALPGWLERALCHGGKVSFSFYLLHAAVIHTLGRTFGLPALTGNAAADTVLLGILVYALTWAIATLSYRTVEEPFLRMRRSYGVAEGVPRSSM
ncbi:peptidoglycan/LPS O-acetylase OafA/YrhL [Pseudoduganella lurida]|uniref:Peptidoglycan/LPS O-acetylase OafA/YrhL n=1 Tax=Pseudoduganella lurida TaxID=1036180 RepID=A0A562R5G6_9BURK|nr:acyltransferase [Pseudoduganella lurida]TWI64342.1 peptidoglycan/LPS O-acetylase OafA/YrhL [Pseudoduganella lurida]